MSDQTRKILAPDALTKLKYRLNQLHKYLETLETVPARATYAFQKDRRFGPSEQYFSDYLTVITAAFHVLSAAIDGLRIECTVQATIRPPESGPTAYAHFNQALADVHSMFNNMEHLYRLPIADERDI